VGENTKKGKGANKNIHIIDLNNIMIKKSFLDSYPPDLDMKSYHIEEWLKVIFTTK